MGDAPLFGTPVPTSAPAYPPQTLKRQLAAALLAGAGDTSPVGSPWAALNRAISPLAGILATRSADRADSAAANDAAPIYAQLAHSDDPISIAAMSNNPLIRALLPQLAEKQITSGMDLRNDATKLRTEKGISLELDPKIEEAKNRATLTSDLELKPQIAAQTTKATESARLPYLMQLENLRQQLGYANHNETVRHDRAIEATAAGAGGATPTLFGSNPASLYGGAK